MKYTQCPRHKQSCTKQPCYHHFSTDNDYLMDLDEWTETPTVHGELWSLFYHPDTQTSQHQTEYWKERLERCRRIKENHHQIHDEMDEQYRQYYRSLGYIVPDPSEYVDCSEDLEIVEQRIVKKIEDMRNRAKKASKERRKMKDGDLGGIKKGMESLEL